MIKIYDIVKFIPHQQSRPPLKCPIPQLIFHPPLHHPYRNPKKSTLLNFVRSPVSHFCLQFHRVSSMQRIVHNPKNYIKNRSSFQDFQCGICFDLSTELVRCKGPCGKVFCIECVSKTKNVSDRCPNRCSKPFFAVKLPTLSFEFACPFSPHCRTPILSVDAFHHHHLLCAFTPPQELFRRRLKQEYRCPLQHNLQFFIGKYNEMVSSICAECQQQKLCRSICRKCDEKYCIDCRMPPCSRRRCPMGHDFKLFKDCNLQYICDVCGMNASIFNTGIYDDKECNFGICEDCIGRLPEERDNNHLVRLVNNQEKCECGMGLVYQGELKPHPEAEEGKRDCCMCERSKDCPKSCPKCKLNFCLKCKSISIYDDICQFQHEFTAILGSDYGGSGCMRCDKPAAIYMQDSSCGVTLCLDCREYFHAITTDKQRLRPVFCEEGHKLCFMREAARVCRSCKVGKNVELICLQCEGKDVYYCFQCKPVTLEHCYFDHPMSTNHSEDPPVRVCSICSLQHGEHKSCKKCKFYACKACHNQSIAVEQLIPSISLLQIQ